MCCVELRPARCSHAPVDVPAELDAALGGGGHGAVVVEGVLGGNVVLQEPTLWILLLKGIPLPSILQKKGGTVTQRTFRHLTAKRERKRERERERGILLDLRAVTPPGCGELCGGDVS